MVVEIDADPQVRELTATIELSVTDGDVLSGAAPTSHYQKSFRPGALGEPSWPLRLVVAPHSRDTARVFTLTATALDDNAGYLTEARLRSSYVRGQVHFVRLTLTASCIGVTCGTTLTCLDGTCQEAFRAPSDTPLFSPLADAAIPVSDAALLDAQVRDAGGDAAAANTDAANAEDDAGSELRDAASTDAGAARDLCAIANGGCDMLVACHNQNGRAVCGGCPAGYSDVNHDGSRCRDIDECAENNGDCDRMRTCTNTPGGRLCGDCPAGYTDDGASGCKDVDECASNRGGCDMLRECINTAGGFHCSDCLSGYKNMGVSDCVDIDECAADAMPANGGCDVHRTCVNTPGSHACGPCASGFTSSGATGCVDIDECASGAQPANGGCDPLRMCVNVSGGPPTCGDCPAPRIAKDATSCKCPRDTYQDGTTACIACPACTGSDGAGTDANSCSPAAMVRAVPAGSTDFDTTVTTVPDATLFAEQITLTASAVLDMFGISKTSSYPDTANVRLGLYSDAGDRPGANMMPKTSVLPLSGVAVIENAPQTGRGTCLAAGKYWIAVLSQGSIGLGQQSSVSALTVFAAYPNTDTDLPATWPTGSMPSKGANDNVVTSQPRLSVWLATLQL